MEPLQAAYNTESGLTAASKALEDRKLNMNSMITYLKEIQYVSTLVLKQIDPRLITFFNVNTPRDLRKAENILQDLSVVNQKLGA